MLNNAVVVSIASLLVVWPSPTIMEQIICVTSPASTKIIVLMRKDVFIQWELPEGAGCVGARQTSVNRLRAVTGIRG